MIPIGLDVKVDWKTLTAAAVIIALVIYSAKQGIEAVAVAVNPVDKENVFNQAVEKTGQAVTGDSTWTPGGAFYDLGHDNETNEPNFFGKIMDKIIM